MAAKELILTMLLCACIPSPVRGDGPGRIYTKPAEQDAGSIRGSVKGAQLTHAIAVERDRTRVYLATLAPDGGAFHFEKLPVGRFDLVFVTRDNRVIEGLALGGEVLGDKERAAHLETGVTKADSFFNRHLTHRSAVTGGVALVFVERLRDGTILRGSGEKIDANLRRLEVIELREAEDDWQMVRTRHLYREESPRVKGQPFFSHQHLPAIGGLRVAGSARETGVIDLTK